MKREHHPGIEFIEIRGAPGYEDETLTVSNGLINGLRIEIFNDDLDADACFHVDDAATALQIAEVLTEYAQRIANPPEPAT